MRLALVQVELEGRGRAADLQRCTRAVDDAADQEPAPDLILLPGGLDMGGAAAGRTAEPAHQALVRETLAWKAREWGVYIAAGLHARSEDGWAPCGVLFDPDGDIVAATGELLIADEGASPAMPRAWQTPFGAVGVWDWRMVDQSPSPAAELVVRIVPWPAPIAVTQARKWEMAAERESQGYWAMVCPASGKGGGRSNPLRTGLYRGGLRVVAASGDGPEITWAEVPSEATRLPTMKADRHGSATGD